MILKKKSGKKVIYMQDKMSKWYHNWIDVRDGKRVLVTTHYTFNDKREIIKEEEVKIKVL